MNRETSQTNAFHIQFTYTDEILTDFASLYQMKGHISPVARVLCGIIGVTGVVYFGISLYREGINLAQVGYLILCVLMILVACSTNKRRGTDNTLLKYRRYYQNKSVTFQINESGVEMKLEGQRNVARSKFQQIYSLIESSKCFYFVIGGKAYYIISKAALPLNEVDALRRHMEHHCKKEFQYYNI